ncbi:PilZ domain-containing protein [Phosphitispora sp. TUW77]|uniref:PilZ domain-containing protein n=1 Tax=Phosphitispora sp. TUW77 TaxID=3152361 RepID=UPI003AB4D37E
MNSICEENRRFLRVDVNRQCQCKSLDLISMQVDAFTTNLSVSGACVQFDNNTYCGLFEENSIIEFALPPSDKTPDLRFAGRVVWCRTSTNGAKAGIEFMNDDVNVFSLLKFLKRELRSEWYSKQ